MRCSKTFLSGWLPGSFTTVPARVAVFGGEPASRAWIRARRISTQKARTRRRFMTRIKVKGTIVETRLAASLHEDLGSTRLNSGNTFGTGYLAARAGSRHRV